MSPNGTYASPWDGSVLAELLETFNGKLDELETLLVALDLFVDGGRSWTSLRCNEQTWFAASTVQNAPPELRNSPLFLLVRLVLAGRKKPSLIRLRPLLIESRYFREKGPFLIF